MVMEMDVVYKAEDARLKRFVLRNCELVGNHL